MAGTVVVPGATTFGHVQNLGGCRLEVQDLFLLGLGLMKLCAGSHEQTVSGSFWCFTQRVKDFISRVTPVLGILLT